jgi:hypothetical protein
VTFPDLKFNAGPYALVRRYIDIVPEMVWLLVQQFELMGPNERALTGTADLRNSGPIDVKLEGNTDAAVLALFDDTVKATGAPGSVLPQLGR